MIEWLNDKWYNFRMLTNECAQRLFARTVYYYARD
jgi:hypothetical protein